MESILDRIEGPRDLDTLSEQELESLCAELRKEIIETISHTGGHLAANLGVVELTVALLRTFDPPGDKIILDTGHQSYTYKLLTGRKDRFGTLRQYGGISGFQRRSESEYDAFGAGHAGTALSAALGMAVARDQKGADNHVVAVLGDAAASCGVSLEALNNVATTTKRLVVILNDNEMSIGENVGSLSRHLGSLLASSRYNRWKRSVEKAAQRMHMGFLRSAYYRLEESIKGMFLRSVIFEELGLRYIGPVDGHNIHALLDAMKTARASDRPILLHVSTRKGKGYSFAEEHPEKWHGATCFDVASGDSLSAPTTTKYSNVFGSALVQLGAQDESIVAITAGMCAGTGLSSFSAECPGRLFDVGISEEHAVVFAAGLAAEGMRPVFAVYSTFMQRAIDCLIHDVALQKLPVVFCLDRAGIVGDDGPTHHGVFDIALMRPVPGLIFMQPKDEPELCHMLKTAFDCGKPVAIRYPRGTGPGCDVPESFETLPIGKAEVLRAGGPVQIWALGDMIPLAEVCADRLHEKGIEIGIVNPRFIKPLDEDLLKQQAATATVIVTIENGVLTGGFGDGVAEVMRGAGFTGTVLPFGWPDDFVTHGTPAKLMEAHGLTAEAIVARIRALL
ncbi:MAG: 1-deoxy-D-xylulose-5-phosphate synthase [Kiritimatiellia bacterium]|jgi:1-deoxy-D-xylulose-5-phosphate synthase|nr:1-deoxy-D-xylulose-5-phosphate synthase [Kiritimatiellia bacterium]MDP7022661.1 1-deoxy-D-xylulose-5-phosphate synthase [Kiritimatiellia bacterium]